MIRKFYDAAAGDNSGSLPPSLADIDNPAPEFGTPRGNEATPPITEGDGTPKIEDITNPPTKDEPAPPVEGLNPDGTLMEGYEKDADGKVSKTGEPPADEPPTDEDGSGEEVDFFLQVEQLTGEAIEVEYGDTDPLTPAGIAKRDVVIRDKAVEAFDQYLKASNPRGYAYYTHSEQGLPDEDFFKVKTINLPDATAFSTSVDMQTSMVKQDLINKGIPEDIVELTVAKYIKENSLTEKATAVYNTKLEEQTNHLATLEKSANDQKAAFNTSVANVTNSIVNQVKEGLGLIVPDAKKPGFVEYVKQNLRYDDGKFFVVSELGNNLKQVLEAQYFQYVKGDLGAIIKNKANTIATQRLKVNVDKANAGGLKGGNDKKANPNYVPLGDL